MWSSQLFNYNEAVKELQIEPSSINKLEWDTWWPPRFTTFWPLKVGTPSQEENSTEKKYQNARSFFS